MQYVEMHKKITLSTSQIAHFMLYYWSNTAQLSKEGMQDEEISYKADCSIDGHGSDGISDNGLCGRTVRTD